MNRFEINWNHVKEQFERRYKQFAARTDEIIDRVANSLRDNTPDDWRFTESPSSRFFVIEAESNAKFLGMSYRDGPKGREIVSEIQNNTHNFKYLFDNLNRFVSDYIAEVTNPELPIVHNIRTVYASKKADIAEEKRLSDAAKFATKTHVIPIASRKIASRPNVVVTEDGVLWVRQYMNWLSMRPRSREYYLFRPLIKEGIRGDRCVIFSHSESGKLELVSENQEELEFPAPGKTKACIFPDAEKQVRKSDLRSESYWKVPTYLDRRLIDLDFKERHLHKKKDDWFWNDQPGRMSLELLELYFIRKVTHKARKRLYNK